MCKKNHWKGSGELKIQPKNCYLINASEILLSLKNFALRGTHEIHIQFHEIRLHSRRLFLKMLRSFWVSIKTRWSDVGNLSEAAALWTLWREKVKKGLQLWSGQPLKNRQMGRFRIWLGYHQSFMSLVIEQDIRRYQRNCHWLFFQRKGSIATFLQACYYQYIGEIINPIKYFEILKTTLTSMQASLLGLLDWISHSS